MNKVIGVFIILLLCLPTSSKGGTRIEQETDPIEIYFDLGSYAIDPTYMDNEHSLNLLSDQLLRISADSLATISRIDISNFTSPDGDIRCNIELAQNRSTSACEYIESTYSLGSLIKEHILGVAWDELRDMALCSETPYKEEVAKIIETVPVETWRKVTPYDRWLTLVESRNQQLMDLMRGLPYRYMQSHIFPYRIRRIERTIK
ncbi:MAG: hypothetical protein R3Y16_02600 [Rikenellaceae bacterium]